MQTQHDHVHAYRFLAGRMESAVVLGDPSSAEVPARRATLGLFAGVVAALLAVAGVGVYGLISPGGDTAWRQPGAILVEKETGTRYVYRDGLLRPTLNYASALLLQGGGAGVHLLSHNSLAGLPRGAPIGIAGAPETVPRPADLARGPWLLCLSRSAGGSDRPTATLDLRPAAPASSLPDDRYAVVAAPDSTRYLVWKGTKYGLAEPSAAVALGASNQRPVRAPQAWLDALPTGPDLAAARMPDAGKPGPAVGGRAYPVGQLFRQRAANGSQQLYVLRGDGLAPLSPTEYALLDAAHPGTGPVLLDAAAVAVAPHAADDSLTHRLPNLVDVKPPENTPDALCLLQRPAGAAVATSVVLAGGAGAEPAPAGVIRVLVRGGGGMLVAAVPLPEPPRRPDRYLISDAGKRYPLPTDDDIQALGLGGVAPVPMTRDVLALVPPGPALTRAAAIAGTGA